MLSGVTALMGRRFASILPPNIASVKQLGKFERFFEAPSTSSDPDTNALLPSVFSGAHLATHGFLSTPYSNYPTSHPYLFNQMKDFYAKVVKGPAPPAPAPKGFFQWYHNKYMARGNESGAPLLHYVLLIIPVGYVIKVTFTKMPSSTKGVAVDCFLRVIGKESSLEQMYQDAFKIERILVQALTLCLSYTY